MIYLQAGNEIIFLLRKLSSRAMLRHESEEGGVVIRGKLEVTVGDQRRVLGPGDAYYFDSHLLRHLRNIGDEECEIVSACTPPTF